MYSAECAINEQKHRDAVQKQKRRAWFEEVLQEAVRRANEEVGT